jgi:hypothetical protein
MFFAFQINKFNFQKEERVLYNFYIERLELFFVEKRVYQIVFKFQGGADIFL